MDFESRMKALAKATEAADSEAFVSQLSEDAVYSCPVYGGPFVGKKGIKEMVEKIHFVQLQDCKWDVINPVSDGHFGYAAYIVSYSTDNLPGSEGCRPITEGVCLLELAPDGRFTRYSEALDMGPAYVMSRFEPGRIVRIHQKTAERIAGLDEARGHNPRLPWLEEG